MKIRQRRRTRMMIRTILAVSLRGSLNQATMMMRNRRKRRRKRSPSSRGRNRLLDFESDFHSSHSSARVHANIAPGSVAKSSVIKSFQVHLQLQWIHFFHSGLIWIWRNHSLQKNVMSDREFEKILVSGEETGSEMEEIELKQKKRKKPNSVNWNACFVRGSDSFVWY